MNTEKPYVPFYKPYGMTDEEYEHEVKIAEQKLIEWQEQMWEQYKAAHPPKPYEQSEKYGDYNQRVSDHYNNLWVEFQKTIA